MSVVSVLYLPVREGTEDYVARAYEEAGMFELARQSGGFRSGRLLRPLRAGAPMLVIAEWDSTADYERWLENPVRASLAAQLMPLLAGEIVAGTLYRDV